MNKFDGMTAITYGVFDLLHYGHFELFRRIRELVGPTGKVIVMLQWDEWITKYKDVKIVYDFETRKKMIEALRYVDEVVGYDAVGIESARKVDFNLLVRGPEHNSERFQQLTKWCLANGKSYTILPRTDGVSTTSLKQTIKDL